MNRYSTVPAFSILVALSLFMITTANGADAARFVVSGHMPPAVAGSIPAGRLPATNHLHLAVGLPLRNQAALDEFLRQLYDPASTNFHKFLTPEEFTARFGPTKTDYQSVIQFAEGNGLVVAGTHPNHVVLDVEGSVSNIEHAFQITLRLYPHPTEARTFYAPDAEPSVNAGVPVLHISGLDNFALPRPRSHRLDPTQTNSAGVTPKSGSGSSGSYAGGDFRAAYVPGVTLNGSGQAVALLEFDGYYANDIASYENAFGLPAVTLMNVAVDGGVSNPGSGNGEVALDIEMAIAMAPGLSQILVYEAPNPSPWPDLLNRMANDNSARQISCSWGGGSPDATSEQIFKQMAAQGQSFFNASGDSDAFTGAVPFPSDSTNITQVGGTTLTTTGPGGAWSSETAWNWGANKGKYTGTSGGISTYYSIPPWQQGISMTANHGSTTMRDIPDVALTADNIYVNYNNGAAGIFGGTSAAAPLWAAFTALVNQQAATAGQPPIGFVNPAIYAIGKGTNYPADFHDTTTGNNFSRSSPANFPAVAGYDLCTGWGTPAGAALINALVPPAVPYFTSQPTNQTVTNGSSVVFSVNAGGQSPLSFQWQFNGTNLTNGANVSGATSNTLALVTVTPANAGNYRIIVTNNFGAVTSSVAMLTVVLPPSITVPPPTLTLQCGSNANFTVTAGGTAPLNYQWSLDGTPITAATNTSLSLTNVHLPSHTVAIVVTNLYGSATRSVPLTVQDTLPPVVVLNGANPAYLELGGVYAEPGATAYDLCAGTLPVTTNGSVNTAAIGTNFITYLANDGNGNTNSAMRTVIVRDTTPPTILWSFTNLVLAANSNCAALMPNVTGTNYIVANDLSGALAITQNPTNNFSLPLGTNAVVITVADASGNKSYSTNRIVVKDETPPVIALNGGNPMTNELGSPFIDPGATANDTCSGLAHFTTNGTVNVSVTGTNTLTYIAVDGSGNTNVATRTVIVRDTTPPTILWSFTNLVLVAGTNATVPMPDVTGTNYIHAADLSGVTYIAQNPTNNFPLPLGTNAVLLTVADASGNDAFSTNTIIVAVRTNSQPGVTGPVVQGGNMTLSLSGGYGSTYILETRTNLLSGAWASIATNTIDVSGVWHFTDTSATNIPQNYYRLRLAQ